MNMEGATFILNMIASLPLTCASARARSNRNMFFDRTVEKLKNSLVNDDEVVCQLLFKTWKLVEAGM